MSAPIVRIGDLEINQDAHVQERMWKIQRAGWATMALLVLLGAAGLFGHGPVSRTSAGDHRGPLWVEYERFGRHQGSSELRIHVRSAQTDPVRIWIGPDYTDSVEIQQIIPSPMTSALAGRGVAFEVAAPGQEEPGVITLLLEFHAIGWVAGEIRSPGIAPIPIRQFIYP